MDEVLPWLFIQLSSLVGIILCLGFIGLCVIFIMDMTDGFFTELRKIKQQERENE